MLGCKFVQNYTFTGVRGWLDFVVIISPQPSQAVALERLSLAKIKVSALLRLDPNNLHPIPTPKIAYLAGEKSQKRPLNSHSDD